MSSKPTYKISPSSINLMLECPRCFWLQLVKKRKKTRYTIPKLTFWNGQSPKRGEKVFKQAIKILQDYFILFIPYNLAEKLSSMGRVPLTVVLAFNNAIND